MQNETELDLKNYSVPTKIKKATIAKTIETTYGQIANAQIMEEYYREMALKEEDTKKAANLSLQADKLVQAQAFNIGFIDWCKERGLI